MARKTKIKETDPSLSPKEARALDYLRRHGSITQDEAREALGDSRLAVSIMGLRRKGYEIPCIRIDIQNRYGEPTWYGEYILHE